MKINHFPALHCVYTSVYQKPLKFIEVLGNTSIIQNQNAQAEDLMGTIFFTFYFLSLLPPSSICSNVPLPRPASFLPHFASGAGEPLPLLWTAEISFTSPSSVFGESFTNINILSFGTPSRLAFCWRFLCTFFHT